MAVAQRAGGLVFGLLNFVVLKFYESVVDPAPYGSWPVQLFTYLSTGVFKCA